MKYKYKITLIIIFILAITSILTLIHYKLWSMGNEVEYIAVNTSGCINIIYSDNQDILMVSPRSYSDEDGVSTIPNTITVTNYCDSNENISLYLDVYNDSTITDNKLKVNINGDSKLETTFLSDINKVIGNGNILNTYKLLNIGLNAHETKRINYRMWVEQDVALTPEKNRFHANYYILSDKENKKENFMETLLENNKIVENNGLIKYNNEYYFNGNLDNNNVNFANINWKVLGINEDGTIKLIYNDEYIESNYNDKNNDERSVSFEESKIKAYLDEFYQNKLGEYDKYISSKDYCNDTSSTDTYYRIFYGSYSRIFNDSTPNLKCADTSRDYGGSKSYKIGLITLDEAAIIGLTTEMNNINYLYNGSDFYTMSPTEYNYRAYVGIIDKNGRLNESLVNENKMVRPVINLINSLEVTGDGTVANPYLVKLN